MKSVCENDDDHPTWSFAQEGLSQAWGVRMSRRLRSAGFSLIELLIVVSIMGVLFAMSVPAYQNYMRSSALKSASHEIASSIQNLRSRAMSTRVPQTIHFAIDSTGAGDFHVHNGSVTNHWDLPRNITYASGSGTGFTLATDGRSSASQYIILKDPTGQRDTVSVQLSGIVLVR